MITEKKKPLSPWGIIFNRAHLFLAAILASIFLLSGKEGDSPLAFLVVLGLIEALFLLQYVRTQKKSVMDITMTAFLFLFIWEVSVKAGYAHPVLVPSPENVFQVFVTERELMLQGIGSSLFLLAISVGLSLVLGVFLGLFTGWFPRIREAVVPIASVIGPIPPLVYTPYVVAVMPTFRSASIFVIFSACFWPFFLRMVQMVTTMDKKIIQTARVMDIPTRQMLFSVILPYCIPGILRSIPATMRGAFLCLTGAELLGARSGLGYFVKKFSDYANYTKVIAGIILMGIVVTMIDMLIDLVIKKMIRWDYT
ncbi:MAG: ABC transporter permease subunit [Blautia sp.]|nr:ABC transporter permease subunit [Blautia sp.]